MKKRDWLVSILSGLILGIIASLLGIPTILKPYILGRASSQTDQILTLVLNSDTTWKTAKGEVEIVWYGPKGDNQTYTNTFELIQPNQAYIETTSVDGLGLGGIWLSDSRNVYNLDQANKTYTEAVLPKFTQDLSVIPLSLSDVEPGVVYNLPFAMIIPAPVREYIYPEWFAQGPAGGSYNFVGTDSVAGRKVWVVEYTNATNYTKAWIDQKTGIILKYLHDNGNQKIVEATFISIELDVAIDASVIAVPAGYQLSK